MRKIIAMLAALLFTLVLGALPAAARPASSTLAVGPGAPTVGDSLTFSGCGYAPGAGVTVTVQSPTAYSFFGARARDDGCFSTAATETYVAQAAGSYTAAAWQGGRKPRATEEFSVS